jgi:hypothetical protein
VARGWLFPGEAAARVRGRHGPLSAVAASCGPAPRTVRIIPVPWHARGDGAVLTESLGFELVKQNPKLPQDGAREARGTRGLGRICLAAGMLSRPERPPGLVRGTLIMHASIRRGRS